jgi:hypothetical protein
MFSFFLVFEMDQTAFEEAAIVSINDADLNFKSEGAAFLRGFAKHSLINCKHLFCKITSDLRR